MIAGKRFEAIAIGDRASLVRTVTEQDVARFVALTGDDNPLHVDRAYAEQTPYKDVVVHGMLGASWISTLIGTRLPGEGALWVQQSFEFLHPVRLGDELTASVTVVAKHERERLLELEARIENQARQVVLAGRGTVRLLEPAPAAARQAAERPRVAIVTGGAGGIGRAVCERLAADGWSVVLNHREAAARAAATVEAIRAAGGAARACKADVSRGEDVEALVEEARRAFGEPTLVVHAAAPRVRPIALDELTWAELERQLDVQVKGALLLARAVTPGMRRLGFGRIVHVTSQLAAGPPTPGWTAYAVAKGALATLTRCLAVELGPAGITVNAVAPGMTETAFIGDVSEKARMILARQTPTRRLGTPADVAGAVAWLASDEAGHVTGETLRVDGGRTMA